MAPAWHIRGAFAGVDFEVIERHAGRAILKLIVGEDADIGPIPAHDVKIR